MPILNPNKVRQINGEAEPADDNAPRQEPPSQQAILDALSRIYGGPNPWSKGPAYSYYFLNLSGIYTVWPEVAGDYEQLVRPDAPVLKFHCFPALDTFVTRYSIPPQIRSATLPRNLQLCITLDSLGISVPEPAAQIVAASFTTGFVGRLVLNQFMKSGGKDPSELDQWGFQRQIQNPTSLITGYGGTEASFTAQLNTLASQNVFQATGIFLGWKAAGELGPQSDGYLSAAWNLVKLRFPSTDLATAIGEMTSYCLGFILAFIRIQAARKAAGPAQTASKPNARMDEILQSMRADDGIGKFQKKISEFFDGVVKGVQDAAEATPVQKVPFGYDFLRGYNRGCLRSSADVFAQTLRLGYGIGYNDGYAVGYQAGYADGYRDGLNDAADDWANAIGSFFNLCDDLVKNAGAIAEVGAAIIAFV
jgi:hypothetical protein